MNVQQTIILLSVTIISFRCCSSLIRHSIARQSPSFLIIALAAAAAVELEVCQHSVVVIVGVVADGLTAPVRSAVDRD